GVQTCALPIFRVLLFADVLVDLLQFKTHQKCSPVKFRSLPHRRAMARALFPLRNPINEAMVLTKPWGGCYAGTVKPLRVSLVEPVAYLKSELPDIWRPG